MQLNNSRSHIVNAIASTRQKIKNLAKEINQLSRFQNEQVNNQSHKQLLLEFYKAMGYLDELVDILNDDVKKEVFEDAKVFNQSASYHRGKMCFGTEEVFHPIRPILRGQLEPINRILIAPKLSDNALLFCISIPKLKDQLVREIHGHWGYHYHYQKATGERSDTLLTFQQKLKQLENGCKVKALTWERHSKGKPFKARAEQWGKKKRLSIYNTCNKDSTNFSLSQFKTPSNNSQLVWPL